MALHEALIALQTGCSGLLTLKQDDPHFKRVKITTKYSYFLKYNSILISFSVFKQFLMFIKAN